MRKRKRLYHFFNNVPETKYRSELRDFDEDGLRGQEQRMIRNRISGYTTMATGMAAAPLTVGATLISAGVGYRRTDVNSTRINLIRERQQEEGWKGHKVGLSDVVIPVVSGLVGTALGFGVDGVVDGLVSPGGTGASSGLAGGTGTADIVNGVAPVAPQISVEPPPISSFASPSVIPIEDPMGMGMGMGMEPSMEMEMDPGMGMGMGMDPSAGMAFSQVSPPVTPFMDPSTASAINSFDPVAYGGEPQQWIPSYESGVHQAFEDAYPQSTEAMLGGEPSMPDNAGVESAAQTLYNTDTSPATLSPPGFSQWVPSTPDGIAASVVGMVAVAAGHLSPVWGEAANKMLEKGFETGGQIGTRKLLEKLLDNKESSPQETSRNFVTSFTTTVEASPTSAVRSFPPKSHCAIIKGNAIVNFTRRQPGDLWFQAGDDIDIMRPESDDGGWWTGWMGTRAGKFPPDYVRIKDQCRAIYSFDAAEDNELSFDRDDIIEVIKRTEHREDWWIGRTCGTLGVFPGNYVVDIS
jgi:hypothetical protein